MIAGIAMMTTNDVTSLDQTNSGILSSDMPGARCLSIVTTISTETASADSSVKVIICAHMSARFPKPYCGPDSGTYANQPTSGPISSTKEIHSSAPPARKIQYENAFKRGNAMLRVPAISG